MSFIMKARFSGLCYRKTGGSSHFSNMALLPGVVTPLKEAGTSLFCQRYPSGTDTDSNVQPFRQNHFLLIEDLTLSIIHQS